MARKSNRKTPLGDKFDEIDFPLEPSAWSEMAALLPPKKPAGRPLSILKKFGFFMASIPLVLIAFWQLTSSYSAVKTREQTTAETVFSKDKKVEKSDSIVTTLNSLLSNKTDLELNKTELNSTNNKVELINNKNVLIDSESNAKINKTALEFDKNGIKNSDFELNSINKKRDLINNKSVLENAKKSTKTARDKPFSEFNKAVTEKEKLIENNLIHKNTQILNQPVLFENQPLINTENAEKKAALMVDFKAKNNSDFLIKEALNSTYANFNKNPSNVLIASNSENDNRLLNDLQSTDNQLVKTIENVATINYLELRELNDVYSETPQNINNLAGIGDFLPNYLIPISQLWRGNHHQISLGFGHASLAFNNNDKPAINRFRLAYNYRMTPLLGIGISTNYVLIKPQGYYSTTELELNLYFINRSRFESFLSAGYGYRQWDFQNNNAETLTGRGKGFTLGLNAQYAIHPAYKIGLRLDLKQAVEPDFGLLLVFSKCF